MAALPLLRTSSNPSLGALVERVTDVLQTGQIADLEEILSHVEDSQLELNKLVPVLQLLNELGQGAFHCDATDCSATGPRQDLPLPQLDDFQIIGELSRGGMGVVYEAVQKSLGRRVALKVLPSAPILDRRRGARFEKEAQIAATLEHPNIVPVYAVGTLGHQQYYAMQLVPGQSLAELIASLSHRTEHARSRLETTGRAEGSSDEERRMETLHDDVQRVSSSSVDVPQLRRRLAPGQPQRYCESARLAIQAADALQHAHERGVVHRDVKPSNLLVSDEGHLWLADFGLARLADGTELTTTGDLVGTMRYMSPEQARGKSTEIDGRTDVYSLGVTLYELLALQPAFRNARPCTLSPDIPCQEPRPLRRIDSSIPRDLEIVVGKAMAEHAAERYNTAGELADDLRRYVNHRPILAKPPSVWDRFCKLVRRHAKLSCLLCMAALLSVVILSVGMRMIQAERTAASRQEQNAEHARKHAEKNLLYAHAAVDRMFESADSRLSALPNSDQLRHDLLEDALIFYQALVQESPEDEELKYDLAVASDRVEEINDGVSGGGHAEAAKCQTFEFFQYLVQKSPGTPQYQLALAEVVRERSEICLTTTGCKDHAAGFAHLRVRLLSELTRQFPDRMEYQLELALAFSTLGRWLGDMGHHQEALDSLNQAMMIWTDVIPEDLASEYGEAVASTHQRLGAVHLSMNRLEEAQHHSTAAQSRLIDDQRPSSQLLLAEVERYQARLLVKTGDREHGLSRLKRAIEICSELTSASPDSVEFGHVTAECHWDLFQLYAALGMPEAAEQALDVSTQHLARIAGPGKGSLDWRLNLARNQLSHGRLLHENQLLAEASQRFEHAVELLEASVVQFSGSGDTYSALSWLLATCPDALFRNEKRAVQLAERAVEIEPNRAWHWQVLGTAHYRAGAWSECIAACDQARRLVGVDRALPLFNSAMAHKQLGDIDTARQSYQQALNCLEETCWNGTELVPLQREAALLIYGHSAK